MGLNVLTSRATFSIKMVAFAYWLLCRYHGNHNIYDDLCGGAIWVSYGTICILVNSCELGYTVSLYRKTICADRADLEIISEASYNV